MLRAIIGFDHIAKNVNDTWIPNCGYGLTKVATSTNRSFIVNANGELAVTTSTGNTPYAQVFLDLTRYFTPPINMFTIGVRIKQIVVGNTGAFMYLSADPTFATFMLLLNHQQLPNYASVNGENYLEIQFDLTAGTATYWIDDIYFTSVSITTVALANLRNGIVQLAFTQALANNPGSCSIRDIYVTDNIPGDGYVGRIGPRKVYPVTLDSASGTGWTTSDGSGLLAALNVPIETAGAATMTSGASKSPLVVGLNPGALPAGSNVEGVFAMVAGKVDVAVALTGVSVTSGGKTILGQSKSIGTTLKYGNPFGVFARQPNGSRWTAATIDAATLSLIPDAAS